MRQLFTAILFLAIICVYGQQHPALSDPGYNPTVPRLVSMRHRAISHTYKPTRPTIQDFEQKVSKEEINIYVVYEKDSTVGKSSGAEELLNPPQKLMDLYLIYEYTFRIFAPSKDVINENIPSINVVSGGFIDEVRVVNYFVDGRGKLKNKKLKKSGIITDIKNGILSVILDKEQLTDDSSTEISIRIKSRNFTKIIPSISDIDTFEKSLTLSYPAILKYKISEGSQFKIDSSSTSTFELLHFRRDAGVGNGNIDKVQVDTNVYTWSLQGGQLNVVFELEGLNIPTDADIGISPADIIRY